MAVSISLSITQNSRNITNNTSNVTVKVTASWTGGSNNRVVNASGVPQAKGWVKIDGKSYDFASTFNDSVTTTGSKVVCTKTVNVSHNSNGTKTLACSASYTTGVSSGTVTTSASKTLTAIPRKSTLSVSNGTLGTQQTLTVTRQSTDFTHVIKAVCGSSTLYIKADGSTSTSSVKHNDCSIPFTPPLDWAKQNTTDTSVSVSYTITTYNGTESVGSSSPVTRTYSIPASVKPSCTITVTDSTTYSTTYGGFVKGYSKFKVTVKATQAQNSPIASYKVVGNGVTKPSTTSGTFDLGVIKTSGSLTIKATVTDKRGRTSTEITKTVTVFDYNSPNIKTLNVGRCDVDGNDKDDGDYVKVTYEYSITSLNSKNKVTSGSLEYKKSGATSYTTSGAVIKDKTTGTVWFKADTGSSYDVKLTVTDSLSTSTKTTSASTAFTIMHWNKYGTGMAIGKVSEDKYSTELDIGLPTRFRDYVIFAPIDVKFTPNTDKAVTITRCSITRHGNMITAYLNVKYGEDVSSGNEGVLGTIPDNHRPARSVATMGVAGTVGSAVCWVTGDGTVKFRPCQAYTANNTIEFNLTWIAYYYSTWWGSDPNTPLHAPGTQ